MSPRKLLPYMMPWRRFEDIPGGQRIVLMLLLAAALIFIVGRLGQTHAPIGLAGIVVAMLIGRTIKHGILGPGNVLILVGAALYAVAGAQDLIEIKRDVPWLMLAGSCFIFAGLYRSQKRRSETNPFEG